MNTFVEANLTFLYGDAGWTAPSFVNAWVNVAGYGPVGYRLFGIWVHFQGLATSGTAATMFTLPVGYRPTTGHRFAVDGSGTFQELDIVATGVVQVLSAGRANISLDGVFFATI